MIIYAYVMGESVAALFLAGIVPGILVGVGLMVMVRLTADHYDLPEAKRVAFDGVELGNLEKWVSFLLIRLNLGLVIWAIIPMPKTSVLLLWVSFLASVVIIHALLLALRTQVSNEFRMICKRAVVPLQTPVLILGGILGGIFTPTEAAAVAVAYAIFVAFFVLRTMSLKDLPDILSRAGLTSAVVLLLVGAAMAFKTVVCSLLRTTALSRLYPYTFRKSVDTFVFDQLVTIFRGNVS